MSNLHKLLPRVEGNKMPTIRMYLDTESFAQKLGDTATEKHTFRLGYANIVKNNRHGYTTNYGHELHKPADLFDIIDRYVHEKEKAYVFAHNYNYDSLILDLFNQLKIHQWSVTNWIIDSDMFIVTAKKGKRSLAFIDSFNYFKTSIKEMGKTVNLDKLDIDFNTKDEHLLMTYCKRDCDILMTFMEKFQSWWLASDYGNFRYTLASSSFEAFRHKFMKHDIWLHHDEESQLLETASYRGGRAEAFFIGKPKAERFYKLDVNSMYPYVMKLNTFPIAYNDNRQNPTVQQLTTALDKYLCVADVEFTALDNAIGVKRERLIFPTGRIRATLTTPELQYLKWHGIINKVYSMTTYRHANIFREFIDHFYNARLQYRQEGNKIYDTFAKLLMNSLYGKFGQQNTEYRKIGESPYANNCIVSVVGDNPSLRHNEIHLNGNIYVSDRLMPSETAFIAIASHVTAYARMLLWKYMLVAGLDNVYYVDTDSLFVNKTGLNNLADYTNANALGMLKLEAESEHLMIKTVKEYEFGNEIKRKGIRKDAEQLDDSTFRQVRFSKIRSMLHHNISNAVYVSQVEKHLSGDYLKGNVQADGKVIPFQLAEW